MAVSKVLLVDDDPVFTLVLQRVLTKLGFEVITKDRAFGVLEAIAKNRPAAVFLDVQMPGLDGPSVAKLIASQHETKPRIFLCSSLHASELQPLVKGCGADGFITKAKSPQMLEQELQKLLAGLASA